MTDYLHHYNVVIDPEQGTQLPDGSWTQDVTLVLLDAPGPTVAARSRSRSHPSRHASSDSSYSPQPNTPTEPATAATGTRRRTMTDHIYQQLREHLAYLKLPAVAEQLAQALEQAESQKPSYTRFLADLLSAEIHSNRTAPARRTPAVRELPPAQDNRAVRLRRPTVVGPAPRRRARHPAVHRGEGQRAADRTARSPFTLPSSLSSLVKQSSTFAGYLDSQAFSPPAGDLDRFKLAALDLVQNGLAGASEPLGGVGQGQVAVGNVGHEPRADLVGQPDPPRCVRGGLLARQQAGPQPPVDRGVVDTELAAACSIVHRSLSVSGAGAARIPCFWRTCLTRGSVNGKPVPVRRSCLLRIAAI